MKIPAIPSLLLASFPLAAPAAGLIPPDPAALAGRADLDYAQAPARSEAGLPIGNGRMGTLLWTGPSALHLQVNRVDVFGNGAETDSFPERNTDYCGGCAFVDVDFSAGRVDPFPPEATHAHLSCADGLATVAGAKVTIRAVACAERDVIALEVEDRRGWGKRDPIAVDLRMLRPPLARTRSQLASSHLEARGARAVLEQKFSEGSFLCRSAVAVGVVGREADIRQVQPEEMKLVVRGGGSFVVLISSAAGFDAGSDLAGRALAALDSAAHRGFAGLAGDSAGWWRGFWSRSYVSLHSADGAADEVERDYNYFLYLMGSTSRGAYPTKFNGMLWITGGDVRRWGGMYWGANQSCFYNNALFASNHADLMEPMWNLYSGMLPAAERAARQEWGSEGAYLPETVAFDGPRGMPDDVAAEVRELYLMRKPWAERSARFRDYAVTAVPYASQWNWIGAGSWKEGRWVTTERGSGPYGPTSHIFSRGAKIAYQYWLGYEYSGDRSWLRAKAYPVLRGEAEFYRHFPNLAKEGDGLYHIRHVNSNEPLWDGTDTDEELASMVALFPVAARAADLLGVDSDLAAAWREVVAHVAPLPMKDGHWVKARGSAAHGNPDSLPDGNTLPTWFFDLCTLESPAPMRAAANATLDQFLSAPRRRGIGILSKIPLAAATLGRASAVQTLILAQDRGMREVFANRMDLSEGEQSTNVERLGDAADALHTALCQDLPGAPAEDPVLRVFPAWPAAWDASFRLLCRGGFLVSSEIRAGRIPSVEIRSQRGGECRLRNPWPGRSATLYRNGTGAGTLEGDLFRLDTAPNEELTLVPQTQG